MSSKYSTSNYSKWSHLRALITRYGEACRADAMKGGGDPESIPEIEKELELAKFRVDNAINNLEKECKS